MAEKKLYQPSNGTEGMWFTDKYCMNCQNCDPNPEGEKQCGILAASMGFSIDEDGYPSEWIYDDAGEPCCTSHKPWNWDTMGNPDDQDNPNYVMPHNPNQTTLFPEK